MEPTAARMLDMDGLCRAVIHGHEEFEAPALVLKGLSGICAIEFPVEWASILRWACPEGGTIAQNCEEVCLAGQPDHQIWSISDEMPNPGLGFMFPVATMILR